MKKAMVRRITGGTVVAASLVAVVGGVLFARVHAWAARRTDTSQPMPPDLPRLPPPPPSAGEIASAVPVIGADRPSTAWRGASPASASLGAA